MLEVVDGVAYDGELYLTANQVTTSAYLQSEPFPLQDLTFRILNREWEYSHKKGFKCVFDRDTLYLYFNFKRQRYRR